MLFGAACKFIDSMERETGLEPATSSLGSWHSTTELLPLACQISYLADSRRLQRLRSESPKSLFSLNSTRFDPKTDTKTDTKPSLRIGSLSFPHRVHAWCPFGVQLRFSPHYSTAASTAAPDQCSTRTHYHTHPETEDRLAISSLRPTTK